MKKHSKITFRHHGYETYDYPKHLWLISTLIIGGVIAISKPALLIPWITPGLPPPGPFG